LQCCGSGMFIPDPGFWFLGSGIRKKTYSGSRIRVQGSKRHRIPDPDQQKCFFAYFLLKVQLHPSSKIKSHWGVTKHLKSRFFSIFLLVDGKIRIRRWVQIRIQIRTHKLRIGSGSWRSDPKHWLRYYLILETRQVKKCQCQFITHLNCLSHIIPLVRKSKKLDYTDRKLSSRTDKWIQADRTRNSFFLFVLVPYLLYMYAAVTSLSWHHPGFSWSQVDSYRSS
jgi:hypothetical protein